VRSLVRGDYWREEPKYPIEVSELFGELIRLRCSRLITCERYVVTNFLGQESDARGATRQIDQKLVQNLKSPKGARQHSPGQRPGFRGRNLAPQPCKGEIPWFVVPLQGLPECETGLDDPGRRPISANLPPPKDVPSHASGAVMWPTAKAVG
jgi:hypothetical protein